MKNIDSLKYFLDKWETVDGSYQYSVPYHKDIDPNFSSLPTFVAEFHDCKVHSCPLLVTYEQKLITNYIWGLTDQRWNKPGKTHKLWKGCVAKIRTIKSRGTSKKKSRYKSSKCC